MKRIRRDNLIKRTASVLGNNDGASLVFAAIVAIIVLTAVVILRVTTTTFMASANRQLNQDQAYELAASLGSSIDELIEDERIDLSTFSSDTTLLDTEAANYKFENMSNASVKAEIVVKTDLVKILKVTANVGKAQYVYTKEYLP